MADLGKWNSLEVVRLEERGVYLDGHECGEILLPTYEGGQGAQLGSWMRVFIYNDSEDRLIATTKEPKIIVGECAALKVIQVNEAGAFLDWGLSKDLMLPFGEQKRKVSQGVTIMVQAYVDEKSGRIAATTKLGRFLGKERRTFLEDEQVDIVIVRRATQGYNVIVEGTHWGMIYHDQIFQPVSIGDKLKGYVLTLREDDKVDIILQKPGAEKVGTLAEQIMTRLQQGDGFINVGDKSDALSIQAMFGVSKKTYKKALGQLYKERKVQLEKDGVKLL
jgi:predicted RNA-binding protein (virulence factor B family)